MRQAGTVDGAAVLARAGASIRRAKTPAAVERVVLSAARDICRAAGAVWWRATDGNLLRPTARQGVGPQVSGAALDARHLLPRGNGAAYAVLERSADHLHQRDLLDKVKAERLLLIPIRQGRRDAAALTVHDGDFEGPGRDLLVALSHEAALALECLDLTAETRYLAEEQTRSAERLETALTSALSLAELLSAECELARGAAAADACGLFLAEDGSPLRLRAHVGALFEDQQIKAETLRLADMTRAQLGGETIWDSAKRARGPRWLACQRAGVKAAMTLALAIRGEPLGALVLLSTQATAFPERLQRTMRTFASQAAVAIENLQLFESTQRRLMELADLTWVGTRISASHDVSRIAATVADAVAKALDGQCVAMFLTDTEGRFQPIPEGQYGLGGERDGGLPARGHIGAEALESASPHTVADAREERWADDALVRWLQTRSLVVAPMIARQGLRGLFVVGSNRPLAASTHAVALVSNHANQTALALQSALLYQDVVRHLNQLSRLFEVSRTLASSLELSETLDAVLASASELLDSAACTVMLVDRESGDLVMKAARGFQRDEVVEERIRPGQGLSGRAVQSGRALTSTDVSRDGRFSFRTVAREEGLCAGVAAPLIARGRTLGVISLYRKCPLEFTEEDKRLLVSLANSAAVAIENADLHRQAQERAEFLRAMMGEINHRIRNTLQAIAGLLRMELERPQGKSAEGAIKRGIARIQSAAVVHELMRTREFRFVDMKQVARRVFELTRQSVAEERSVTLQLSGTRVMLPSQKATAAALFLAELVDNSLRHGVAGDADGKIWISLTEAAGNVVIQVRDNGSGLPERFDLDHTSGLGFRIVRGLVEEELGGRLEVEVRDGLTVRARFPKH